MEKSESRYVARLRDDGAEWCVIDRRTGAYAVPASLRLDRLPEDTARLMSERLNELAAMGKSHG
ncbi:hypothetical protein [Azospirillum rugosum]|uniref:TubC N-terminal docking domain-containing protein n=1 Tax=Azospirillum rugosum TaxID=416170 RepID=A0ABS4SEC2_9PROT|nr:hypothetical protein [Azospirillum rugosum]MBP2290847.1 hypothetical protein [Azospirillum rugosum]MDQ0529714.1 hypothetical protein [Azospirillum rugosum]